jgi:ferrous iron transport protein B
VVVWVLSTFPYPPEGATGPAIDYSFAGRIGHFIAPLMAPIGFNWQMTVALIPGFAAREVAVAALGTVYAVGGDADSAATTLGAILTHKWSLASALSFLAWYIFAPQCAATLGVVKRETNGWTWPTVMFVYMTSLAYLASFATYHIAVAMGAG